MSCPVPDAHRRLDDAHAEWHDALDAYFDPHRFRRSFNSFLASFQSTIDTIARRKRSTPGGEETLKQWETTVKGDRLYKWAVKARNLVVHEADLSLHSLAWVEHAALDHSRYGGKLEAAPESSADELLSAYLLNKPESIRSGVVKVSRKWVDNSLPDKELLEVASHLYGRLAALVAAFHSDDEMSCSDLGLPERDCTKNRDRSRPKCMAWGGQAPISRTVDLSTRHELAMEIMSVQRDPSVSQQDLEQRYGSVFKLDGDPIKESLQQMRRASLYLTVDSEAMPWMLLYKGSNLVDTFQISAVSKPTLLAMFSGMAERVRTTGADGFLFTAEAWTTWHPGVKRPVHQHEGTFYDVKPDRGEVLLVVAATSDGRRVSLQRHFARDEAGWPVLGRVVSTTRLGPEWRVVVEALSGLPRNSAFRRD